MSLGIFTVLVNGQPFQGWKSCEVDQSYDKAVGNGNLSFTEQPFLPMPIKLGDDVQVLIDDHSVIKGYAFDFTGDHAWDSHQLSITIRDQTQSFVDSTVGPKLRLKPPITMKEKLDRTLGVMGLGHIKVIDNANPEPFGAGEVISGAIDDPGFTLADAWASKREVLLNTDGNGNLVIDRNTGKRGTGALYKSFEDSALNNVKRAQFRNSLQDRHNKTAVSGQKSANDRDHWESKDKGERSAQAGPTSKRWGTAHDSTVRKDRRLHTRGSKGINGSSPKKSAKWRSKTAKARGLQYIATVAGYHASPGVLWWPGLIIPVRDDHFEIDQDMLITNVKWKKTTSEGRAQGGSDGGSLTEVTCCPADGFSAKDGGDKAAGRTSKGGVGAVDEGTHEEVSDEDMGLDHGDEE
jgi:prophage tail gpP-like protein